MYLQFLEKWKTNFYCFAINPKKQKLKVIKPMCFVIIYVIRHITVAIRVK